MYKFKSLTRVAVIGINFLFLALQCNAQTEYTFAPAMSFSAKPTIKDSQGTTLEGDAVEGVLAEFRATDSFQRVEIISLPKGYVRVEVSKR